MRILVAALCFTANAIGASADDLSLYGVPDTSRPEYGEQAYLRGEWSVEMAFIDAEGTRKPLDFKGHVTAYYHSDGKTLQTCFRGPNFYSTDIQAFDEVQGKWRAHFLNANAQRWSSFEVTKEADQMIRFVPGGFAGNGDDVQTIAKNITHERFDAEVFSRKSETSDWVQTYAITYTRLPNAENGPRC